MPSAAFAAHATVLLQRIQRGLSAVELVHVPHDRWPLPHLGVNLRPARSADDVLRISVLDSSFNPPTLAHLALANTPPHEGASGEGAQEEHYDARLLLLSVRNADKALKKGDATFVQRLEMMQVLAKDVKSSESSEEKTESNTAVAIIDEPTFVGKSRALLTFLCAHLSTVQAAPARPQLTFLQGFDTLERLFAARYYASSEAMLAALHSFFSETGDGSRVVCARRMSYGVQTAAAHAQDRHVEEYERERTTLEAAKEFINTGRVVLIDIGEDERKFSSSEVREKIARRESGWPQFVTPSIAKYIGEERLYADLPVQ